MLKNVVKHETTINLADKDPTIYSPCYYRIVVYGVFTNKALKKQLQQYLNEYFLQVAHFIKYRSLKKDHAFTIAKAHLWVEKIHWQYMNGTPKANYYIKIKSFSKNSYVTKTST